MQVVEALPEELALLTMRSALCARPHTRCHGIAMDSSLIDYYMEDGPAVRCMQARLLALISHLPPEKRYLAILAHRDASAHCDPRGDCDRRAILLPLADLGIAACITEAVALLPVAGVHVTSLSITSLARAREESTLRSLPSTPGEGDEQEQEDYEAAEMALPGVLAPLAGLTALVCLNVDLLEDRFRGHTPLGRSCQRWVDMFYGALGSLLGNLTQLTSLRVYCDASVWEWSGQVSCEAIIPGLSKLTRLRSLEVNNHCLIVDTPGASNNAVVPEKLSDGSICYRVCASDLCHGKSCVLAEALHNMSYLTSLRLQCCPLSDHWKLLLPALAHLPLLSLDLAFCYLNQVYFELPGVGIGPVSGQASLLQRSPGLWPVLSGLQCLRLERNWLHGCVPGNVSYLSHLTSLTELMVNDSGGLKYGHFVFFLRSVKCPRLKVLYLTEAHDCESDNEEEIDEELHDPVDIVAAEICSFLERCRELQTVVFDAVFYARMACITRSLAMLPHLSSLRVHSRFGTNPSYAEEELHETVGRENGGRCGGPAKVGQYALRLQGLTELSLRFHEDHEGFFGGLMQGAGAMARLRAFEVLIHWEPFMNSDPSSASPVVVGASGQLVSALSCLTGLTRLQIQSLRFTEDTVFAFAECLACMPDLRDFMLSNYRVGFHTPHDLSGRPKPEMSLKSVIHVMPRLQGLSTLTLSRAGQLLDDELEEVLNVLPQMRALSLLHLSVPTAPGDIEVETALASAMCPGVEVVVLGTCKDMNMIPTSS